MKRRVLFARGGVALADILANSVAVILILIIITINVQQEKAQQELEKNADITSILGRQLASNIVFNELPTSSSARLHDYESSTIPHDIDHTLWPVIELHRGYIRLFNDNIKIYRNELLRPQNAFDDYIKTLTPEEREKIRMDIRFISEYYTTLAILKEHNIRPRHWHYLGEHVPPLENNALAQKGETFGQNEDEEENTSGGNGEFSPINRTNNESGQNPQAAITTLPGMSLADADMVQALQYDSLLPSTAENQNLEAPAEYLNNSPSIQNTTEVQKELSLYYDQPIWSTNDYSELIDALSPGQGRRSMKLHIPNIKTEGDGEQQLEQIILDKDQYNPVVLAYLLKILSLAEHRKTLQLTNGKDWLKYFADRPDEIKNHPNYELINQLDKQLQTGRTQSHNLLNSTIEGKKINDNQLLMGFNTKVPTVNIQVHQKPTWLSSTLAEDINQLSLVLRLYPSLFQGEILDIPKDWTILLHPEQLKSPQTRWRPIAVLDAQLEDISIGFVYASIAGNNLVIDAGANQVSLNQKYIANPVISEEDIRQNLVPLLWLLALATIFVLILRYRHKQLKPLHSGG